MIGELFVRLMRLSKLYLSEDLIKMEILILQDKLFLLHHKVELGMAHYGPQSRALCSAVCIINSYSTLLNWPIVSLLILFILFSMFFVLIHDYALCFTGFPCCNFSYYNYISVWPYYIVIGSPCCSVSYYNYISVWPYYIVTTIIWPYYIVIHLGKRKEIGNLGRKNL